MEQGEFLKLVSRDNSFIVATHEIKTPLSIIRQLSLILNDDQTELTDLEKIRIIKQIDSTSERALRIVQDLTKVSRLQDAIFELEPVNARRVCVDVQKEMKKIFELHGRKIIFKHSKINDLIVANYDLLRSILLNFGDNALYCSDKNSNVEVSIKNSGQKLRISVRDYGEELPTEIWRVIKKQKNAPVRAASRPQSSGLGLFIAQNFAKAMNAQIGVIRHRDGNTFYIELNKSEQLSLI